MRLKIICEVSNNSIPLDYRRKILMMIKKGLAQTNDDIYKKLFEENTIKDYTFSVFLPDASFEKDRIHLKDNMFIINFSTSNVEIGLNFYNAFMFYKGEKIEWNNAEEITIKEVNIVNTPFIKKEVSQFRTLSPIVCRNHNQETRKDWFHDYRDAEFEALLKRNLTIKLVPKLGEYVAMDINQLKITPTNMKKTVVKHYEKQIACSIGRIELEGKPYLLNEIYENGLGSMTGTGFGMLEQI